MVSVVFPESYVSRLVAHNEERRKRSSRCCLRGLSIDDSDTGSCRGLPTSRGKSRVAHLACVG
jgi:hypothetical protein